MEKLAFCDYHNMVAILEKTEQNINFHQIVNFLEASHIRETKILAKVNGRQRTVSESSIMRHLKLNDEEGISTLPDNELFENLSLMGYNILPNQRRITRGTIRISQSKVPLPGADEIAFPTGHARYGEAFPTGVDQGEDLLVGATVKDSDKSANKKSDSTDDMANVLGTLGAANILASRGLRSIFTTASLSVATASEVVSPAVATASESFPTAAIFTTASVTTPNTRVTRSSRGVVIKSSSLIFINISFISKKDKGKGKMIEPEQPSKEKAERELKMMIAELYKSNEMVAKYLSEYEQAKPGLSHDENVELVDELLMYQRHLAQINKYQVQQNKPTTKTERRNFYMSILRSNAGWKVKDFKGMTFEHIEEKFILVWENMQDFVPMNSKL
nr:hypothetical protein [Tanacetum cinerariifolium]